MNKTQSRTKPRRTRPAVLLAAALVLASYGFAGTGTEVYSGAPINLNLDDARLQDVLTVFSEATDYVFALDPRTVETGVLDNTVSVTFESVPWDRALDEILFEAGLEWTLEGKVLWIHLPDCSLTGDRRFTGDTINLRLDDAKVAGVLDTMAKVAGISIDFDPDIDTTVSVRLRSIPWDQVLDLVLRISGFEFTVNNGTLEVTRVSDSLGMQLITDSQA